jgi:hypothetical protein
MKRKREKSNIVSSLEGKGKKKKSNVAMIAGITVGVVRNPFILLSFFFFCLLPLPLFLY